MQNFRKTNEQSQRYTQTDHTPMDHGWTRAITQDPSGKLRVQNGNDPLSDFEDILHLPIQIERE